MPDPTTSGTSDPLAVRCRACLAPPGEPCIGTTSDLPRERVHRLRPLAASPRLVHCPDCRGSGWQATATLLAPEVTCPVCGALPTAPCTEGGTERRHLHVVRRRAARAGLEPCGTCEAVGWVPAGEPEPTAPRLLDAPEGGVHVIPGEVPEGVVPPSTSLTPPRPDVPDLIEMTAAAICNNDNHGVPWDQVRKATAERYRRLARRTLNAVAPEIERRAVEAERAAIIGGIKHYFSPVDDELWDDVQTLIGRIERGEYGARKEGR